METETYKAAKEILEKHAPEQLAAERRTSQAVRFSQSPEIVFKIEPTLIFAESVLFPYV